MKKLLLALIILGAGAGVFHAARQSMIRLQHEATASHESWLVQTQRIAVARSEQAGLVEHVRDLKQDLLQRPVVIEDPAWSALRTNRTGSLSPELRGRLLEELGFNWQSSPDYIVVSKQTLRELYEKGLIQDDGPTAMATAILALTPGERGQVEAAIEQVKTELRQWELAHVERIEPKDDVVAHYVLPGDPATSETISNHFAMAILDSLGEERAEVIRSSARGWMFNLGVLNWMVLTKPSTLIVRRYVAADGQVWLYYQSSRTPLSQRSFPAYFRPLFPNGWAGVVAREGFTLPDESQGK